MVACWQLKGWGCGRPDVLANPEGEIDDVLTLRVDLGPSPSHPNCTLAVLASSPIVTFFHTPWSGHHWRLGEGKGHP